MRTPMALVKTAAAAWLLLAPGAVTASEPPAGRPEVALDLATREGVEVVNGAWRYRDVTLRQVDFRAVGQDRKPSGAPNRTWDYEPKAGAAGFDDRAWPVIDPATLAERRGDGRLGFAWYRFEFTVPEKIGGFDPSGATAIFEITVDDYAEVWVDGVLERELGQRGGAVVAGFNVPNRVVAARDVQPGQRVQLAVFAMNGPISASPENYIWVRGARLEFHGQERVVAIAPVPTEIVRLDPALDALVAPEARIERLATGFQFTEGPVWTPRSTLLFSDPNENRIYEWSETAGVSILREASGYAGADVARLRQPGSNGLALDAQGRLTICEHGNRRVTRLEKDGSLTVLADRYEGKRLNSPNDLVYTSDGALYFTDPPFGLPKLHDDPDREQPHFGVYRLSNGVVALLATDLRGPNGLDVSPDERFLYVANWDEKRKIVMRYERRADGTLGAGQVFFDMGGAPGEEALDGLEVDARGNLYVSGPGGVWVLSPDAKHLGTIRGPELPANLAWGGADRRTLYLTARTGLYRLRMNVEGGEGAVTTTMR